MKLFKKIIAMGVLSMAFSSAYAVTPSYGQTTVVDFEELYNSTQTELTNKGVTFGAYTSSDVSGVADATFRVDSLAAGLINTTGAYYLSSDYDLSNPSDGSLAFTSLRMSFSNLVSSFNFNLGGNFNSWGFEAFDIAGDLIDSQTISPLEFDNSGAAFGISSGGVGISYAVLTNYQTPNSYDRIALDNLTFTTAVPEPSVYALMLGGLGLVGFMARRRKQA